jgi:predicted AlkP superfamily phosphohydrolase/phosphomutase/tetratricopeptide (TPR) repeat protein
MPTDHQPRKVLLIGWDAADWKVIMPLVDAGKMPNLGRLLEEGICGNMATLQPVLSPMLWTSIATGKRPYKHGIHGFSEPDPVSGGIRPVTNLSRKTKAVWNILNQNGLNTIVIGWWPSNPAEELSRGVMVSNDFQTAHGADPENWPLKPGTIHPQRLECVLTGLRFHPAELTEVELRPFLPGLKGMSREELDKAEKDPRMQSLMKTIADCTSIHSAATALIQNEPWDFMAVYYDAIDHFGHAFMRYHPPRRDHIDEWDFRVFNYCLEGGYRYHDMMLGTLLRLAGEGTTVILMSDHGFHPDHLRPASIPREPTGPAVEHRQFGIFAARGPGIRKDERIYGANLLDICPTLLHLFGLPVGEDMDGKVLLDIYEEFPPAIERIPSWDGVEGDHGMHPPDRQISPADSKAAIQQLVALGYIAEPNADKAKAIEETVRELDYHLAMACIDGGVYNQAVDILERLYATWPMEHRFGFKLTSCYQSLGRTADLRRLVTTLIERRVEEAKTAAEALKALKLDDPDARAAEKERLDKMTDPEKQKFGRERGELIAKARPNLFSLRYLEACADFAEKKYGEALARLEQLDSDYGARRNALVLRGEICQRLKRWEESRAAFEEALEIDPESPGPLLGLARTALAAGDFETAASRARESIGLLFFQPRAHYIHGLAQYRLGNWEEAGHAFVLCVRQAPLFSAAYRMLAEIARWHGDIAEQAVYQVKVQETRRRLVELRARKRAEARLVATTSAHDTEARPMPLLLPHPESLAGVPAGEIITVVSGLPRSGTSLMMQILEAAGIPPFTDGRRRADESNRKGYYEHDNVASLLSNPDRSWLVEAKGTAIKVVAPLLAGLPARVRKRDSSAEALHYRVLFMEREMKEVLQSQETMLERLGRSPAVSEKDADIGKAYCQQERHAKGWCASLGVHAMSVSYEALVHRPDEVLPGIGQFLEATDRLAAMRACINPNLYRARG